MPATFNTFNACKETLKERTYDIKWAFIISLFTNKKCITVGALTRDFTVSNTEQKTTSHVSYLVATNN